MPASGTYPPDAGASTPDVSGLDRMGPTALYHQVYVVLREQILEGAFSEREPLPGEHALARMFGVSRITARRALDDLAAEGLVRREQGRGTYIVPAIAARAVQADITGLLENLLAMGLKTEVTLVEFDYVIPTAEVALALRSRAGERVQKAVRIRKLDGEPFSYLVTFVPEAIGKRYTAAELATKPLLGLLEACGVEVTEAEQTIGAALADTVVARALGVRVGSPLLSLVRVVKDQTGAPVEYIRALYRPDKYQYKMTLSRVRTADATLWRPVADGPLGTEPGATLSAERSVPATRTPRLGRPDRVQARRADGRGPGFKQRHAP